MECCCVVRNKPIRCKITKLQNATVISLWFWGLLAYPELYCDWPLHNQHSRKFSGVHGFLSLTVIVSNRIVMMMIIPSTYVMQRTLTLKMTTAQVVKTSVTAVNKNSPIQDYIYPDDQTQPTFEIIITIIIVLRTFVKPSPTIFFLCLHVWINPILIYDLASRQWDEFAFVFPQATEPRKIFNVLKLVYLP